MLKKILLHILIAVIIMFILSAVIFTFVGPGPGGMPVPN